MKAAVALVALAVVAHQLLAAVFDHEMPPAWLGLPGFILGVLVALNLRGWRALTIAGIAGAAVLVVLGVAVVVEAEVSPEPADPYTAAENAGLAAAWSVLSALGWLVGVGAAAILRGAVAALRRAAGRARDHPAAR